MSTTKVGSTTDQTSERDPRAALLKSEVVYADLPDPDQLTAIAIAVNAVEKHVLVPTKKTWNEEDKKLLEREVERTSMMALAAYIKKELDLQLGPSWHVVYGRSFASFTTHERMSFMHFKLDDADIIIWKHG